jgi:DNA-binding response OmpR family regulator
MRILLVEDEALVALVVAETLELAGHEIEVAATAGAALTRFHDGFPRPDMLVAEATLPDLPGWEVLNSCRAVAPGLPAVIVTENPMQDFRIRAYAVTLQKPFTDDALLAAVRAALAEPNA